MKPFNISLSMPIIRLMSMVDRQQVGINIRKLELENPSFDSSCPIDDRAPLLLLVQKRNFKGGNLG